MNISGAGVSEFIKVEIVDPQKFINLDIGCGENKRLNYIGMDKRPLEGVDIVHDLEVFPYPLEDGVCHTVVGSHIVEHIKPWLMIDFMNELWRILRVGGQIAFSLPYGVGPGFVQDPTHCNPCNEITWEYFDPNCHMWNIYKPKPFQIDMNTYQVGGFMEVLLMKITEEEGKIRNQNYIDKCLKAQV
jgi:SAM-dependent methyltransferase